jgi:hypothetical protein
VIEHLFYLLARIFRSPSSGRHGTDWKNYEPAEDCDCAKDFLCSYALNPYESFSFTGIFATRAAIIAAI